MKRIPHYDYRPYEVVLDSLRGLKTTLLAQSPEHAAALVAYYSKVLKA